MYDVGDTARLSYDLKDANGTLVNATGVTLTVTLPDDTTATPTVTNPPAQTGKYFGDFVITQAGWHRWRFVFTTPADAYADVFEARPTQPAYVVSLDDAKLHLNIDLAVKTHDEELRRFIGSATRVVESKIGAAAPTTYTEVVPGGWEIVLGHRPVLSLTSFTAVHTGADSPLVADLDTDLAAGIVRRKDGGPIIGRQRVVYRAGRTQIPDFVSTAALMIVQHLWDTQRGGAGSSNVDQEETIYLSQFGFSVPRRALELLEGDLAYGVS